MSDQANRLRGLMERRFAQQATVSEQLDEQFNVDPKSLARTIVVTSGKGGVGKSNIALNLAIGLSQFNARVCLIDANLGLGNVDLLCGLNGYWNLSHVVSGARRLPDVLLEGPENIRVVCGASGLADVADCSPMVQQDIFQQLHELEQAYDYFVIDAGIGNHPFVRQLVIAADIGLIVTTPEPTAIADAYAMVKSLSHAEQVDLNLLVNLAESAQQARTIIERLQHTSQLFLKKEVTAAGWIPNDEQVRKAVACRRPVLIESPECDAAEAMVRLAKTMKHLAEHQPQRSPFFGRLPTVAKKAA